MATKPTEIKLVASILDQEHEDAETAAKAVIEALDAKREGDPSWAAFVSTNMRLGGKWLTVGRGPFTTKRQAEKALLRVVSAGPEAWYGSIVNLKKGGDDG